MSPTADMLVAGKITGVYGVKGWVKIHSYLDNPKDIELYELFCRTNDRAAWQSLKFEEIKNHGKGLIGKIDGYDTREHAETLRQYQLGIKPDALPELSGDDFYWHDLIGLKVLHESGQVFGVVDGLMETGANDVLVVKPCDGSIDKRERLIPYIVDQFVVDINLEAGFIKVDWDAEF